MGTFKFKYKQVEDALRAGAGMPAVAAARLGCTRQTVYNYMKRHPRLWDITHHERETFVDLAEAALKKAVLSGELGAICFTLKTLGKKRGYYERAEYEFKDKTERPDQARDDYLTRRLADIDRLMQPTASGGDNGHARSGDGLGGNGRPGQVKPA